MIIKSFEELADMSVYVGNKPDIVQSGGGNTSVKMDNGLMAIKASGCKLGEMTPKRGFVVVNHKAILNYFEKVDLNTSTDYEQDIVDFVSKNIVDTEGIEKMRPSVEAPFHSFLQKYVIHTHSVYANVLCCSLEGKKIAEEIFGEDNFVWIPYVNPGFFLSMKIRQAYINHVNKYEKEPKIFFMQNHGLIVTDSSADKCKNLNDIVNKKIVDYLHLSFPYPIPGIEKISENKYKSTGLIVRSLFNKSIANYEYLDKNGLYPDQLVYINKIFAQNEEKIVFDENDNVIYNAPFKEATGIEDTLSAYLYVVDSIRKLNLNLSVLDEKQKSFIYGWEIEKYRLTQLNK